MVAGMNLRRFMNSVMNDGGEKKFEWQEEVNGVAGINLDLPFWLVRKTGVQAVYVIERERLSRMLS